MNLKKTIKNNEELNNIKGEFIGWDFLDNNNAKIIALFNNEGKRVKSTNDKEFIVVLDKSPFYAEKGGQAADSGKILLNDGSELEIVDVQQNDSKTPIQLVKNVNEINVEQQTNVKAIVNKQQRLNASRNHTAAHLTYAGILSILGKDILEDGNANNADGLYIDFHYTDPISKQQISDIEQYVKTAMENKIPRETHFVSYDYAVNELNALAVFTGRYDEQVRVIKFGDASCELCGGTHVENTADLEDYMISEVKRKDAQRYRLRALTSKTTIENYINDIFNKANELVDNSYQKYEDGKNTLKNDELVSLYKEIKTIKKDRNNIDQLNKKVDSFQEIFKTWEKEYDRIVLQNKISKYLDVKPILNKDGVKEINLELENVNGKDLSFLMQKLANKNKDTIIVLKSKENDQNFVAVWVDESLNDKYSAIDIFRNLEPTPKGGGNKNRAQGKY